MIPIAGEAVHALRMLDVHQLPDDVGALKAMILEREAIIESREARIEALEAQLALLKRRQFGRSSERLDRAIAQLELALEDLREDDGLAVGRLGIDAAPTVERARPKRAPLPAHLPTEDMCARRAGDLSRLRRGAASARRRRARGA